jgi:hypothetical protein
MSKVIMQYGLLHSICMIGLSVYASICRRWASPCFHASAGHDDGTNATSNASLRGIALMVGEQRAKVQ